MDRGRRRQTRNQRSPEKGSPHRSSGVEAFEKRAEESPPDVMMPLSANVDQEAVLGVVELRHDALGWLPGRLEVGRPHMGVLNFRVKLLPNASIFELVAIA